MKWIDKMERKCGRYAIRNLSSYIIALYVAGYLFQLFSPTILNYLTLEPYYILRGQIWRLVTWIIIPPSELGLFTVIMLYFYYSVGNTLERTWGAFRYNLYILSGMLFTIIGAFLLFFALRAIYGRNMGIGSAFSTYYVCMSIMLAFTATYPNAEVLLYFFIPIKMKWLGVFYGVLMVISFVQSGWPYKIAILSSLLNFIVFFLSSRNVRRFSPKERARKMEFKKAVRPQQQKSADGRITRHKCAVCGRTELDGDNLEFRFCSKCDGNYEYCQDHLFTHEHVHK